MAFEGTQLLGRQDPLALFDALAGDLAARGLLTPQQATHARAYVPQGHLASSALIAVGAPPDDVIRALSTLSGLPPAPPRDQWKLDARTRVAASPALWEELLAVPIGDMGGRPMIAYADPFAAASSKAMKLPPHVATVALEADVREALAASPAGQTGQVSFLAPPSAVTQGLAANTSAAFSPGTTPALAGTMAGAAPNMTPAPGAPQAAAPGPNLPSFAGVPSGQTGAPPPNVTAGAPPNVVAPTAPNLGQASGTMVMGGANTGQLPTPSPTAQPAGTLVMGSTANLGGPSSTPQSAPGLPSFHGAAPSQVGASPFTTPNAAQPAPAPAASVQPAQPAQPAAPSPNQTLLSSGEVIGPGLTCGKYVLESKLGEGGMAIVFAGRPVDGQGPKAAVKVIHEHLLRSAQGDDLRRRFEREVKAMQSLQHPNIVACLDAGRIGTTEFLSTEFIGGGSLQDLLQRTGRLPPLLALSFFGDLLDGLEHAHERGIVHRDLKPDNLLLAEDGTLKVADFGIARVAEGTQLTATGGIIGTPSYMSPEQALADPLDARTDLYSSGVILYELLTGRNPFVDSSVMATLGNVIAGNYRRIGEVEPAVPMLLDVVLARMMATRPDDRYSTATTVKQALAPLLERAAAFRASWAAVVGGDAAALPAAFAREADALASEAKAHQKDAPLRAAFAAFRATRLVDDHPSATAVLKALGDGPEPVRFARPRDVGLKLREGEIEGLTGDKQRTERRDLAEDYLKERNPLLATGQLRRAVADFGLGEGEAALLSRLISDEEIEDLRGLDARLNGGAPKSEAATVPGRAWKPAAQQTAPAPETAQKTAQKTLQARAPERGDAGSAPAKRGAPSSGGTPTWIKAAILIAATAIPLAVLLAFARGCI